MTTEERQECNNKIREQICNECKRITEAAESFNSMYMTTSLLGQTLEDLKECRELLEESREAIEPLRIAYTESMADRPQHKS